MSLYIDTEDLKATLQIQNTEFADDDLDRAAAEASDLVDEICGRTFGKDTEDTTRYFTPEDPTLLRIDDLVSVTSVAIDRDNDGTYEETLTVGTDFRLGPPNAQVKGEPYTWLEAINGQTLRTRGYVKIVGTFGWPTVPTTVVSETGIMAAMLVSMYREHPFGIMAFAEGGMRIGDITHGSRRRLKKFTIKPALASPRLG